LVCVLVPLVISVRVLDPFVLWVPDCVYPLPRITWVIVCDYLFSEDSERWVPSVRLSVFKVQIKDSLGWIGVPRATL